MLYGRAAEVELVDELLEGARQGRSGSLVFAGVAGIGKSALLAYAAARASGGRVLQVRGVQAETAMPFAGLHALLRPVREHLPCLSGPQRRALGAALGIESGEAPSRFLVGAAVVELLATLAEQRPVVCLVDDAQWIDPESLGAVAFAARRMPNDRLALLAALRMEAAETLTQVDRLWAGMPRVNLGPLDDEAADQLLEDRPSLDRAARSSVKAAARGHPLALLSLSAEGGSTVPATPLSLTSHLAADYLTRADGLDGLTRRLLLLAAADDTGDLTVLMTAAGQQGGSATELAAAEERALLRVQGNRVEFVHPLVRSAIYQASPSTVRREAHLALADALSDRDPGRSTWHRACAAIPPADELATELATLAAGASRRAATDLAARAYERAAELTSHQHRRFGWLLDAAEASWEGGQVEHAAALLETVRDVPAADDRGRIDELRGRLEAQTGSALQGYEILVQGAEAILASAPRRAADMLMVALRTASICGDMNRVVVAGRLAARLVDRDHCPAPARFAAGIAELLTGTGGGGVAALQEGLRAVRDVNDPDLLSDAATAALFAGDFAQARLLGTRAAILCRDIGSLRTLAQALEAVVVAQVDNNPRQAEMAAEEGRRAARETDQTASEACHMAYLAGTAALRGDRARTEDLARRVFALDETHSLAFAAGMAVLALCALEVGLGRPEQALLHYETLTASGAHRAVQLTVVDFGMLAAVWSGHRDAAMELLARMESSRWMREAEAEWSIASLNRWRALVAEGDQATALFERSLAHQALAGRPFYEALTHLLLGEHLRRGRQRMAARPHLRAAAQIFQRLDATPWAARASNELRASGESVRRPDDGPTRLTPQELQVAQLVATGLGTKAVAAQLYLSPRTIDSHLRQIFAKLGISARAALRDIDLTGCATRPLP